MHLAVIYNNPSDPYNIDMDVVIPRQSVGEQGFELGESGFQVCHLNCYTQLPSMVGANLWSPFRFSLLS